GGRGGGDGARARRLADRPPRGDRRRPLHARAPARPAAGGAPRRAHRDRRAPGIAQSDPPDARGLLRRARDVGRRGERAARPRGRPVGSAAVKATAAIAGNVFRESVRDKVLYNLALFAILLIGASVLIGQLTAGQDIKIIKDLGLSATGLFGLFIAVFIGIGLVSKEVERRSIYSLLAKPIDRCQLRARTHTLPA